MEQEWISRIEGIIEGFPEPHRDIVRGLWNKWLKQNPAPIYFENWDNFIKKNYTPEPLYDEVMIFIKRISNELKELEFPPKGWQKVTKVLASATGALVVGVMILSRILRATE